MGTDGRQEAPHKDRVYNRPSCEDQETLYQMIRAGMDVARFNFSHGTHEEHGMRMENLRWAAERAGSGLA